MSEVVYKVLRAYPNGSPYKDPVTGFQIGRFAIRTRSVLDVVANTPGGRTVPLREYLIDHINTGVILIDLNTWKDALLVADDVSRYSPRDMSTKSPSRFLHMLGPKMVEWLKAVIQNRQKVVGYRQYWADKGEDVHATRKAIARRTYRPRSA